MEQKNKQAYKQIKPDQTQTLLKLWNTQGSTSQLTKCHINLVNKTDLAKWEKRTKATGFII